jgi:ABC-type transport system involved in multi-copper enzyme maturation permease subunit
MALWSAWVVFLFECRRALRPGHLALAAAMAIFPAAVIALVQLQGARLETRGDLWVVPFFVLIPEAVCLLGLLLWASPILQAEVEAKTWTYLAVRPGGKAAILVGKYAAAVVRAILTALAALTLAMAVFRPAEEALRGWACLASLVVLSSLAYASLYLLLGVLFVRRAMTIAVIYTFALEFLVGWIPAVVNQLTVQYYLRSLLGQWYGLPGNARWLRGMVGIGPAWQYALTLVALAAALLVLSAAIVRRRELVANNLDA